MGLIRLALAINTALLTLLFDDSDSGSSDSNSGEGSGGSDSASSSGDASSDSGDSGASGSPVSGSPGAPAATTKRKEPTDEDLAEIPLPEGGPEGGDPSAELPSIESVYGQKRAPLK